MSITTRVSAGLLLALCATGAWSAAPGAQTEPPSSVDHAQVKEAAASATTEATDKTAVVKDSAAKAIVAPAAADNTVPQGFSSYATEPLGDGRHCVVGAVADEDGMNQKPFVYLEDTNANRVLWTRPLDLPANTYQGRATHCLRKGANVYVLLQVDTQPAQMLSQTLLRVVELDLAKGSINGSHDVAVSGVTDAYSAWVDKGEDAFRLADKNGLTVQGEYFRLADPDKHLPFKAVVR
jgi:hypothetical protein